jgi:hypothetical protein
MKKVMEVSALMLALCLLAALPAGAWAQEKAAEKPADKAADAAAEKAKAAEAEQAGCDCIFCKAKEAIHQETPWLALSADLRLHEIFAPNLLLDKEDRHYQRYRARVGATVTPIKDIDFDFRLVYEPRHFSQPDRELQVRNQYYIDDWTNNEAIFDRLSVTWNKPFGLPVRAVIGRQDIILGNGWLVLDGTPLDDSRTIFFDAVRLTWDLAACKTTVDTIYINQHADSDRWIEPFCDKDFHNIEQDEQGVIIYITNKSLAKTELNGYFIYKHDEAELGTRRGDIGPSLPPWQAGDDADIYTFGARAVHDLTDNINLMGEFAVQFGNKNSQDLCAAGLNTLATYKFNDACKHEVHVGYEFLSGDESGTDGRTEQFDPLWGRWARFSELLAYTHALENRPGEATNLHRLNAGVSCVPCEKITLGADYNLLFANHNSYGGRGIFSTSPDSNFRGQLIAGRMTYQFNKHISGHLLAELFFPGDFYNNDHNEVAGFFRYELNFTW